MEKRMRRGADPRGKLRAWSCGRARARGPAHVPLASRPAPACPSSAPRSPTSAAPPARPATTPPWSSAARRLPARSSLAILRQLPAARQ
eukprot:1353435-Rhodomonas_salina.1